MDIGLISVELTINVLATGHCRKDAEKSLQIKMFNLNLQQKNSYCMNFEHKNTSYKPL